MPHIGKLKRNRPTPFDTALSGCYNKPVKYRGRRAVHSVLFAKCQGACALWHFFVSSFSPERVEIEYSCRPRLRKGAHHVKTHYHRRHRFSGVRRRTRPEVLRERGCRPFSHREEALRPQRRTAATAINHAPMKIYSGAAGELFKIIRVDIAGGSNIGKSA